MRGIRFRGPTARRIRRIWQDLEQLGSNHFLPAGGVPEMLASSVTAYPNQHAFDDRVRAVAQWLYWAHYCRTEGDGEARARGDMGAELSAANRSRTRWNRPWTLLQEGEGGQALVGCGMVRRLAGPDEWQAVAGEKSGSAVQILRRRDNDSLQPRFYYAFSESLADQYDELVLERFYLAVRPEAAARWMERVTAGLNDHRIPFGLKMLRYREDYPRADSAVLYLPRRHAGFVATQLAALSRDIRGLEGQAPLFTRPIAPGLAMADDPPGGESFGAHRMRRLAAALLAAQRSGAADADSAERAVALGLADRGVDPSRPWLNPGNDDVELGPPASALSLGCRAPEPPFLDVASRIARQLVRDALHHDGRCSWLGWFVGPSGEGPKPALCSAGADLYSGTAGIALFLGRIGDKLSDQAMLETARAALRHALAAAPALPHIGGYSGISGVVHAAAQLAALWEEEAIERAMDPLFAEIERRQSLEPEFDIVGGLAGAIRALLTTPDGPWRARCLGLANALGERLLGAACEEDRGLWWAASAAKAGQPLFGYAHGNAGIAAALRLLATATGSSRFADAADSAIRLELSGFDADRANWPDHRLHSMITEPLGPERVPFMTAWCNGAPGTALALTRFPDPTRYPQLEPAIATLADELQRELQRPGGNYSLCHGVCGHAEIVAEIGAALGRPHLAELAREAGARGARSVGDGHWPCGIDANRESPGLMIGLAGIGHFYLRLADPGIPTPLLV